MPDRIGGYTVTGSLGVGGMGSVYLARDPRFDRDVAIKVLHPQYREDPGIIERFKSEAVIQAKLSHPHIVTVLDFIAEGDTLAMVMEYIDGKPLDRVIEECRGPMEPDRAVRIMGQVLDAMGFAHSKGLVHRDIKPSNIMIQDLGGKEYAKVMDFGIAKILGSEKMKTATGAKMGTLAYMSPEHVKSPKYVDARSDIYSLGVVLYEMLTGKVPFDADSEYELMRQIVEQEPRALFLPRLADSQLPGALKRALQKRPEQRFPSCDDFENALDGSRRDQRRTDPPLRRQADEAPHPAGMPAPKAASVDARSLAEARLDAGLLPAEQLSHSTMGGWLALFCVGLIALNPLVNAFGVYSELTAVWPLRDRFPALMLVVGIEAVATLALTSLGVHAGIGLWKLRNDAVRAARRYLWCLLGYQPFALALPQFAGLPEQANEAMLSAGILQAARVALYALIWLTYLKRSKRVQRVYPRTDGGYSRTSPSPGARP